MYSHHVGLSPSELGVAVPPICAVKVLSPGSPVPSQHQPASLDSSPVFYHDVLSPWNSGGKRIPDSRCLGDYGLMHSPLPSLPSPGLSTEPRTMRGRSGTGSSDRSDAGSLVTKLQQVVFFSSSTPETRVNGHSFGPGSGPNASEAPSLLKQKQMQRMAQLQFDHPSVNVTPQRLSNPNGVLRDILNANFTSVKFTPKPPSTVPRRTDASLS
jgi:hypothetical protein